MLEGGQQQLSGQRQWERPQQGGAFQYGRMASKNSGEQLFEVGQAELLRRATDESDDTQELMDVDKIGA